MSIAQIFALIIFLSMFALILWDKIERQYVTLGCGLLTIIFVFLIGLHSVESVFEVLNFKSFAETSFWYASGESAEVAKGINWETIVFIAGMMIMVEGMSEARFFRWLCMKIAKFANYKPVRILIAFMVMSFVLAMFIDSITVILFLAAVTVELAQLLKFNPIPVILSEIFCANLGGSATMCGDPPNIIIGTSLHYSFFDFLSNTGVCVAICLIFTVAIFYFMFRKELTSGEDVDTSVMPDPKSEIKNPVEFAISTVIFLVAVVLLVTHSITGLTVSTIGVFIAAVTLITSPKKIGLILKKVDYNTLLFFVGLFVVVGGLEETGVLEIIANGIAIISKGNIYLMVAIIIWVSAIASAFVDNIPFAATMIPIIRTLAATQGAPLDVLAWSLAMGADIGGSATPIGASANVVGTSVAARSGHPITWGEYMKKLMPVTFLIIAICTIYIFVRYL